MDELDVTVDLLRPESYPAANALTNECDLVMKGGITSGIVYPLAVCHLATKNRIRSVGGSSAGAIAAGLAAAAEYGRSSGGFTRLAGLPAWLGGRAPSGGGTNLSGLFQPQRGTRPLYRCGIALLGRGNWPVKAARAVLGALGLLRPLPVLVLCLPPLVLLGLAAWWLGAGGIVGIVAGSLLLVLGTLVAVVWSLTIHLRRRVPANGFGLCSGLRGQGARTDALTEWLAGELEQMAGTHPSAHPLTFGDLDTRGIQLVMLTTDLTDGTQQQAPFTERVWAFDRAEMQRVFPSHVVQHMVDNSPGPRNRHDADVFERFRKAGLHPLPEASRLPVIVGVRMSLSFPLLLSAVPLHRVDYTDAHKPIVRHWFSDGGITSNFPMHFFDRPMPSRPTFGINLGSTDDLRPKPCDNIFLPGTNLGGIHDRSRPLETMPQFVGRLADCLQNWADNAQTHVPGYRDRIVTVFHTKTEGGLNLDMDPRDVAGLAERGRCAGAALDQKFDFVNHRWTRYRSFMQVLEDLLGQANEGYSKVPRPGVPTYELMIDQPPPHSYRHPWDATHGKEFTDRVVALGKDMAKAGKPLDAGAPRPRPILQVRPNPRTPDVASP